MKSNRFFLIVMSIVMLVSFSYGAGMMHYEFFPYHQAKSLWQFVDATPSERHLRRQLWKSRNHSLKSSATYYEDKVSFFEKLGRHNYDVVFIGESIIDHAEWQDSFPSLKIANRGISGDNTKGVSRRLNSIYKTSASKAFVMMGVNDFLSGKDVNKVLDNYIYIVDQLISSGMTVYIQSTLLTGSQMKDKETINNKIIALNERLESYARQNSSATYININHILAPDLSLKAEYSKDGLHLNADGYIKWNELIKPYLLPYLSAQQGPEQRAVAR